MKKILLLSIICFCTFDSSAFSFSVKKVRTEQDTIKVLAVGNSFSEDALEYLDELAMHAGIPLIVANAYKAACSVETHYNNSQSNEGAYVYQKAVCGEIVKTPGYTLEACILDEKWDIITLQQVSYLSGMEESYFPDITNLIKYIDKLMVNHSFKYAFHQTWAYAQGAEHSGYVNYDESQELMYSSIMDAVKNVMKETKVKYVIPSGTAIQNGRTSSLGDTFCKDGYHLNNEHGRYTAACVWYEFIFDESVVGHSYYPNGVSARDAVIAQEAAHEAMKNPWRVADLSHL